MLTNVNMNHSKHLIPFFYWGYEYIKNEVHLINKKFNQMFTNKNVNSAKKLATQHKLLLFSNIFLNKHLKQ